MFTIDIKADVKNPEAYEKLKKRAKEIPRKTVAVGFPKGKLNTPHYEDGASIIDVAIWNNFGIGVPKRDFMTPSTRKWKEFCTELINSMKMEILEGKINIDDVLNLAGQKGADIISEEIIKLRTPPNSPYTIEKKKSSNPLVDTGDMSKAPMHEIREVAE
jgi:hypothetical protein